MKIIQLIGKIKDEPNANKYFADAKKHLEKIMSKNTKVITPHEINAKFNTIIDIEQRCLAHCIENIINEYLYMSYDHDFEIYALWNIVENSKGALLEHKIADALGIPVTLILKSDLYGEENE